jgi:hypothetical protein
VPLVAVDESFAGSDFDGTARRRADDLDLLYAVGHGELRQDEFELVLKVDEWWPSRSGLDADGPRVAVFDACNLLDFRSASWARAWTAQVRPRLRLVLGFASKATIDKGPSRRGLDFAEQVARGDPVAPAWIAAVRAKAHARSRDVPVALAFGSDPADATFVRDRASIADIAALPALGTQPHVELLR